MTNLAESAHVESVNRAIDHIRSNLAADLRLVDVAAVAGFSRFHFHRIFSAHVGETLNSFVRRVRLERAVHLMAHASPPTLADVAAACGFSSSSDFSRCFRDHFGCPPSEFDVAAHRAEGRERLRTTVGASPDDPLPLPPLPAGDNPDGFRVELTRLPARRLAYTRVQEPFRTGVVEEAAASMVTWARERGLAGGRWLGAMWDDPDVVALEDCTYDVAVEVPARSGVGGGPATLDLPPMTVAHVRCPGPIEVEQRALDWLYGTWLPGSGHVPDDLPVFEVWTGVPFEHGHDHFDIAVQLPVRRRGEPLVR